MIDAVPTREKATQPARRYAGLWAAVFLWVFLGTASTASATLQATLVGPDLEPQRITLQSLEDGVLVYFDKDRNLQSAPLTDFIKLQLDSDTPTHPNPDTQPHESLSTLTLNNGQCLVGQWRGAINDGQMVQWEHPTMGLFQVSLDAVRSVRWVTAAGGQSINDPTPRTRDTLTLTNGDTLEGFVTGLDERNVNIRINDARTATPVPIDRIAQLDLAGGQSDAAVPDGEKALHAVYLRDGSVVLTHTVVIRSDEVALNPAMRHSDDAVTLPVNTLVAIDIASEHGRLVDLTQLHHTLINGGEVFGLPVGVRADHAGLHLHAPSTLRFDLPHGASRLVCGLTLDLPDGDNTLYRSLADLVVVIQVDGKTVTTQRLTARQAEAHVNTPIHGSSLTVDVQEGDHGPILDRLLIHGAGVFVTTGRKADH
ncbi:MAG: hypothetical protein GC164_01585 [Phycisphaera sp.]|nr:hypothetical protein [Phycisphaera sp.]